MKRLKGEPARQQKAPHRVINRSVKCVLTDDEIRDAGRKLAEVTKRLGEVESKKKRLADEIKSEASAVQAEIEVLSNRLHSGYDYRDMKCHVRFHDPERGKKTIRRADTDEVVSTESMSEEDWQELGLTEMETDVEAPVIDVTPRRQGPPLLGDGNDTKI